MYEASFGLTKRPFASVPDVEQYYPASAIETARQRLARCIERAEGVGVIVGPSGTGKTLLCRMLAGQFEQSFQVVLLSCGRLSSRRALFQALLFEMGRPYRGLDEGESRLALVDYLTLAEDRPQGMLLLVDEAHTLPLRLLDEIRMITNLVAAGQPAARLVLSGGAVLEERLASPRLESFSQRIVARCYLESLGRDETDAYVAAQIAGAGGDADRLMPSETRRAVHRATDGVPRLINQVCDHALLLACAAGRRRIEPAAVEEAWADLQQLPTPWNADATDHDGGASVIEFGGLDDEADARVRPEPHAAGDEAFASDAPEAATAPADPDADPVRQVETIERAMAELDDEFHPAGSVGPEVELVFDDPFREQFAEEEVIGAKKSCRECEWCGDARPTSKAAPATGVSAGFDGDVPGPSDDELADDCDPPPAWAAGPETLPLIRRRSEPAEPAFDDDRDVIVVEEGYDDPGASGPRATVAVRRQEYGQLFARLRRSS